MRKIVLTVFTAALILLGAGCLGGSGVQIKPIILEYWRLDDSPDVLAPAIEAYRKIHPNVTINVRSFRSDEYEKSLLEALAEDRGPDMMSLPNVWMTSWKPKLLPAPEKTVIPTQVIDQQKKKIVAINQETKTITIREIKNLFVEAVENDVIMLTVPGNRNEKPVDAIWGLPYSLDTLAVFYNIDLLRRADIKEPPDTWKKLQDQVKKLTVLDKDEKIQQSGAAIGTAQNIRHSTDLMTAIMMQNGAIMADEYGRIEFDSQPPNSGGRLYPPGVEALMFYQSFGRPNSSTYTWDNKLPDSMDAFIQGKTAFYFGFPYDRTEIEQRAPQLNFEVAALPQVNPAKVRNIAHYSIEVVSNKTSHPNEAWNFIQFAAEADNVRDFLAATNRPTTLRSLISEQLTDPEAKPFVSQVLTAESWYRGKDWSKVETAFDTMLETYPTIEDPSYQRIVTAAAREVAQTIN
ncbi:extracellular solute-binding protein [Patescibacteria group bacterium]|nr:extracellular solute-binding protein [Patescibacteria group bacterium]